MQEDDHAARSGEEIYRGGRRLESVEGREYAHAAAGLGGERGNAWSQERGGKHAHAAAGSGGERGNAWSQERSGNTRMQQQGQVGQHQRQVGHSPSMANEPAKLTQVLWASSKASPSSTSTRMMSAIHSFTFPKVPCQTM